MKGFVVAGTSSGVGKTTIAAALLAALKARGLAVQPFKCGPDYIDPAHHTALAGRPSYNLDTWMAPRDTNRAIFRNAMRSADVAVVEGVMGLFDGVNGGSDEGSTAEIAKLLNLPVVLVVDTSKMARSVAAIVQGFRDFDPQIRLMGVILNGAGGKGHVDLLKQSIAPLGVPVLGWFPNQKQLELQERHLGLVTAGESTWNGDQVRRLIDAVERHIDLDQLLEDCEFIPESFIPAADASPAAVRSEDQVKIGVARDRAFSFYYQASLDVLQAAGAELIEVSPLSDDALPELDGLYLGGGYPEVFADELAGNGSFLESVRRFAGTGRPIYAECGGLMYLAEELITRDGRRHSMAGALPIAIEMLSRLEAFGYTEVELQDDCLVGSRGRRLRGHSFHFSRVTRVGDVNYLYEAHRVLGGDSTYEGYGRGGVLASYIHLSFAANPEAAVCFVGACREAKVAAL